MSDQPMTYPEKLHLIAAIFEKQSRELGHAYALMGLRQSLNSLSNDALQEAQRLREETPW